MGMAPSRALPSLFTLGRMDLVSIIFEMAVEGESFPNSGSVHDLETDTIDQT